MALNRTELNTKKPVPFICLLSDLQNFSPGFNDTITAWILVVIGFIVSSLAIFFNVLVILAVKKERRLRNHSNLLLASLALVDLLAGTVSLPFFTAEMLIDLTVVVEYICVLDLISVSLMSCLSLASIQHLTVIAWERYVAVRMWMDYKVIVTTERVKELAIAAWILAIFMVVPLFLMVAIGVDHSTAEIWSVTLAVWVACCFLLIFYFYSMMYFEVRNRRTTKILIEGKLASKVAKTTGMVTAALILSFVPSCIIHTGLNKVSPELRSRLASGVSHLLLHCNSVANPLIYYYRNRPFRNAVLGLLNIRKRQQIQPNVRYHKEKKPSSSLEDVIDLQVHEGQRNRLTNSASFDTALVLDSACRQPHGLQLKRFLTTPYRAEGSGSCGNSKVKQHSSVMKTAALIHGESSARSRTNKGYHKRRVASLSSFETAEGSPTNLMNAPTSETSKLSQFSTP